MTNTMTTEEFEALLTNSYTYKLNVADIVKGVVVKKEKDGFLVDIGTKTEAFLPNSEVVNSKDQNPDDFIKLWDEKEFYITKDEEDDEDMDDDLDDDDDDLDLTYNRMDYFLQ